MDQRERGAGTASASGEATLGGGWGITLLGITRGPAASPRAQLSCWGAVRGVQEKGRFPCKLPLSQTWQAKVAPCLLHFPCSGSKSCISKQNPHLLCCSAITTVHLLLSYHNSSLVWEVYHDTLLSHISEMGYPWVNPRTNRTSILAGACPSRPLFPCTAQSL